MKGVLSTSKYNQVVSEKIVVIENVSGGRCILQNLELCLSSLTIIELEMVTGLEVNSDNRILVEAKIHGEDLQTDIIVVHLVVAEGDIDIYSMIVLVFDK